MRVLAHQVEGEEPSGNSWVGEEGGRRGPCSPGGVGGGEEEKRGQRDGACDDRAPEVERLRGRGNGRGDGDGGGRCHGATVVVRRRRPPSGANGHQGQTVEKVNVSTPTRLHLPSFIFFSILYFFFPSKSHAYFSIQKRNI